MPHIADQQRILFVCPEVIAIPNRSEHTTRYTVARCDGFSDTLADLIVDLYGLGVDVQVVQPNYRHTFTAAAAGIRGEKSKALPAGQVHLANDRAFFYSNCAESNAKCENIKISLTFQREVIYHTIPAVQPDLIHCHDWMTGLIPAVAKDLEIPCLFTVHQPNTARSTLACVEDCGIDAAAFWQYLYYDRYPGSYEETREANPVNFLLSGILSASVVDIARIASVVKKIQNQNCFAELSLSKLLADKLNTDRASILDTHSFNSHHYINIYERILRRPLFKNMKGRKFRTLNSRVAA